VGFGVVVDPVGVRRSRAIGYWLEDLTEGVGRPAEVPAETARGHAAQDHALFPRASHRRVDSVQSPEREQVSHRANRPPTRGRCRTDAPRGPPKAGKTFSSVTSQPAALNAS